MRATVKTWGNSASVRIPASVMAAANLRRDQPGEVREERGRVVIEPLAPELDMDAPIDAITDENRHGETDMGAPVGEEILVTAKDYAQDAGGIVWLEFDPRAGREQGCRRPAVVLSPARYNARAGLVICCPTTTRITMRRSTNNTAGSAQ